MIRLRATRQYVSQQARPPVSQAVYDMRQHKRSRPWTAIAVVHVSTASAITSCSSAAVAFQSPVVPTVTKSRPGFSLNPPQSVPSLRSVDRGRGSPLHAIGQSVGTGSSSEGWDDGGREGSAPESAMWHWRNGWEIHYERARRKGAPPLLLLPGFGVGTFHFKRNMKELSKTHDVYTLDLLGQGKSWPTRAPSRQDRLCYSVDTWTEQVLAFVEGVIREPVYIAGNSLGGYIGTNLAAKHPKWVLGLALLNATPFWAFRKAVLGVPPPSETTPPTNLDAGPESGKTALQTGGSEGGAKGGWLGWDGTLPAPSGLFRLGAWYFDRMRDPRTIKSMLGAVYSNAEAVDDDLVGEIIAATERGPSNHDYGVGGHEAFTSIVFAPKVAMSFEAMIDNIDVPMALIYGKEDPWVVPLWGHRIKRQRPQTLYYQVSPSGHSPHHETPQTVNALLSMWLAFAREGGAPPLSEDGDLLEMVEATGVTARATMVPDARPNGPVEWIDSAVWSISNQERRDTAGVA